MSERFAKHESAVLDAAGRVASDVNCTGCGCNLRSEPVGGECPACGQPVVEAVISHIPILDDTGRIAADTLCAGCGYNLRMQPVTGVCPECAANVALSICRRYLSQAQPRWVRRLATGATMMVVGIAGGIGVYIIRMGVAFLVGATNAAPAIETTLLFIVAAAAIICAALLVFGLIRLTTRNPAEAARPEGLTARRVTRYCLAVLWLATALAGIVSAPRAGFLGMRVFTSAFQIPLAIAGITAYVLLPLTTLRHIANLMRRTPRRGLVKFAKIEFWGVLVCGVIYVAMYAIFMFAFPWTLAPTIGPGGVTTAPTTTLFAVPATPIPGRALLASSILQGFGTCAMIGLFIAGFVLLILVRNTLATAARQASETAAGCSVGPRG